MLYHCLKNAQNGSSEDVITLIKKFEMCLKKFARKLYYPEAETDLIIEFLQLIDNIKLEKFTENDEGRLVNYIYDSLNNKRIDLYRKHLKNRQELLLVSDVHTLNNSMALDSSESDLHFHDFISTLTDLQKQVVFMRYFEGYSDSEISKKLNVSRQAISSTRQRALKNLKKLYAGECK